MRVCATYRPDPAESVERLTVFAVIDKLRLFGGAKKFEPTMRRRVIGERLALGTMVTRFLQGWSHDLLDEPGHRDRNFRPSISGKHPNRPYAVPKRHGTEGGHWSSVVGTGDPPEISVRQDGES
jgi:hypothetical protein